VGVAIGRSTGPELKHRADRRKYPSGTEPGHSTTTRTRTSAVRFSVLFACEPDASASGNGCDSSNLQAPPRYRGGSCALPGFREQCWCYHPGEGTRPSPTEMCGYCGDFVPSSASCKSRSPEDLSRVSRVLQLPAIATKLPFLTTHNSQLRQRHRVPFPGVVLAGAVGEGDAAG
jgi:hypothetical protein